MCGFAAIIASSNDAAKVDREELAKINAAMIRRGPDGASDWLSEDERCGLAHRRLAIIDLHETGAQPMTFAEAGLHIVFNGEIYNYQALRAELIGKGHRFIGDSDTEVLLHLFAEEGDAMVQRLRGMYAFVIYDEKSKSAFCARDPFGIKPFFYGWDGKTFRAASQVKALQAGGAFTKGCDPAALVGFHLFGYVPEPFTIDGEIKALPAGHCLRISRDGLSAPKAFFDMKSELAGVEPIAPKPGELREALLDSLRHHLIADVPVGVFLSGGLDSTTLVGLTSECSDSPIKTLTLGFEEFRGGANDEVPLAEEVAKLYQTDHQTQWVIGSDFAKDYDDVLHSMDQPSVDGVNVYFVAKAARAAGLKVALSGLGGDELFGGYNTFAQVPKLVNQLGWIPGGRHLGKGLRLISAPLLKHLTSPKWAGLLELGTRTGDAYLLRRGLYMPWELPDVLDPDLVREGWAKLDPLMRLNDCQDGRLSPKAKIHLLETSWYMRNQLLRDGDWAGMAHSLEIRVPLVDIDLFRKVAPWILHPEGPSKHHMARTPHVPLPASVLNKAKTGFFIPVRDWLQNGDQNLQSPRGLRGWAQTVAATFQK